MSYPSTLNFSVARTVTPSISACWCLTRLSCAVCQIFSRCIPSFSAKLYTAWRPRVSATVRNVRAFTRAECRLFSTVIVTDISQMLFFPSKGLPNRIPLVTDAEKFVRFNAMAFGRLSLGRVIVSEFCCHNKAMAAAVMMGIALPSSALMVSASWF